MMSSKKRSLLFINASGPTHIHGRDHETKTRIRQHVMVDIGKERRKPLQNPQIDVILQFPDNDTTNTAAESETSERTNDTISRRRSPVLMRPFWDQHPLDILEQYWEMDPFSAYGIMLMLKKGRNIASTDQSLENFIFPFAFQTSKFLQQYGQLIVRPDQLAGVSHEKPKRFKVMALQRSLGVIGCIESGLAGTNPEQPSTDRLILAIIAIITFNLISSDFDQALLHICGLESLIAAREKNFDLHGYTEMRLMIFWVDVTTSLLHDCKPRFQLPVDLIPVIPPALFPTELPLPLHSLTDSRFEEDGNVATILSCMVELSAIAALIDSELTVKGDDLWDEPVLLGLWLNPLAHRLLDGARVTGCSSPLSTTSEALRLGALLWIIRIKQRHHAYPGSPTVIIQKLLSLLSQPDWTGGALHDTDALLVELWLLVLCGIDNNDVLTTSWSPVGMVASRMWQMGLSDWSEVMMRVRQMPWTYAFHVATKSFFVVP